MTQDEIIKLARECDCEETFGMDAFRFTIEQLQAFYRAAYSQGQRDMREAAVSVCLKAHDKFFEEHEMEFPRAKYDQASVKRTVSNGIEFATSDCAEAIRALHIGGQE